MPLTTAGHINCQLQREDVIHTEENIITLRKMLRISKTENMSGCHCMEKCSKIVIPDLLDVLLLLCLDGDLHDCAGAVEHLLPDGSVVLLVVESVDLK